MVSVVYLPGIPQNPGQQGGPCDQTIASIVGDDDAVASASGFEPTGFTDSMQGGTVKDRSRGRWSSTESMGTPERLFWSHLRQ